ncbi:DUF1715-domain-containing protein [Microthyrium microscopicum]|uniref:DUF1715-domain-containing protein n=1 Tax=Microthyrium microscopicum TaxID=703497 RepID=A0A6A6TV66_9PEZI|nr:DUF1715-domain-containing protein [Microthyrium microscopicum]
MSNTNDDIFDAALNLEDTSYTEGYELGVADGSRAGRIEGRAFGLEKGFEKFLQLGRLHGRASVWAARLPPSSIPTSQNKSDVLDATEKPESEEQSVIPALPNNPRLRKHVATLVGLTEPGRVTTQNTEEEVAEMDEVLRRAASKVKVVEKIVGETGGGTESAAGSGHAGVRIVNEPVGEKSIEDFGLGRGTRK